MIIVEKKIVIAFSTKVWFCFSAGDENFIFLTFPALF
jgi:hypothetical protein